MLPLKGKPTLGLKQYVQFDYNRQILGFVQMAFFQAGKTKTWPKGLLCQVTWSQCTFHGILMTFTGSLNDTSTGTTGLPQLLDFNCCMTFSNKPLRINLKSLLKTLSSNRLWSSMVHPLSTTDTLILNYSQIMNSERRQQNLIANFKQFQPHLCDFIPLTNGW